MSEKRARPQPTAEVWDHYRRHLPADQVAAMEVLFGLRRAAQAMENAMAEWLGDDAITPGRFQVLAVLLAAEGPLPQRSIVEALSLSRPTVSGLIDRLTREGLVRSTPDLGDRRRLLAELTAEGRRTIARLAATNGERVRARLVGLSVDELGQLSRLLDRVREGLEAGD